MEFWFAERNIYAGFLIFIIPVFLVMKMVKRSGERDQENARAAALGAARYQAHLKSQSEQAAGNAAPTPDGAASPDRPTGDAGVT